MYGLSGSALEKVVDDGSDKEFVAVALRMDETFVGVDHLLEVDGAVHIVRERGIAVEVAIEVGDFFFGSVASDDLCGEDAARKVAAIGDEVDGAFKRRLELLQRLHDFGNVLVLEGLVDAHVARAPGEMGGGRGFDSCSRGTRDGVDADVALQQSGIGQRQQAELDAGGEAAGIGHVLRTENGGAVELWQTVNIVVAFCGQTEVLREVDDANVGRNIVVGQELGALAMTETEIDDINVLKREFVGEAHIGFSIKPFMHVGDEIASVALAVDETISASGWFNKSRQSSPAV